MCYDFIPRIAPTGCLGQKDDKNSLGHQQAILFLYEPLTPAPLSLSLSLPLTFVLPISPLFVLPHSVRAVDDDDDDDHVAGQCPVGRWSVLRSE